MNDIKDRNVRSRISSFFTYLVMIFFTVIDRKSTRLNSSHL